MPLATAPSPLALRVAVIGVGRMGVRHVQAAQQLGMSVCAIADSSEATLAAARETLGLPADAAFTDAHALLARVRPEALVIATTAPAHAPLVLAAASKGVRYILCEKPMAVSLDEADAMIAACVEAGVVLAVNHQMRFMPNYTRVRSLVGTAALGPLVSVLVAGSNFGLAMNASHYFEMFRYMTDAPVGSVQAWLEEAQLANPRGPEFDDRSGRLLARSDAGPAMFIDFSAAAGHGLQVTYTCQLGQIMVDELTGDMRLSSRQAEFRALPTSRYGMPADVQVHQIEPAATVAPTMAVWSAMLAGESYPDGEAGRHALRCLVAAHLSHQRGGREVALSDPSLPGDRRFGWA